MEERTAQRPAEAAPIRSHRFRAGAVIVIALAIGIILWLSLRGSDDAASSTNVTATTEAELRSLADSLKQPIFWVGPRPGYTYELRRPQDGSIHLRYLPSGVELDSDKPYLSVATYPFTNPYQALKKLKGNDIVFVKIPKGGIAEYTTKYPEDLHAAYPGVNYQIEVFDPAPGVARGLLVSGQVTALGDVKPAKPPKPTAATIADLRATAKELGHPIYWVGPQRGFTYELTRTAGESIHIRYLPRGVKLGTHEPYLVVATYPFQGAFDATKALTEDSKNEEVPMPGGGVAVLTKSYPQDIHLAFPGSDFQIEIFDPSAARVRELVSTGKIKAIG